MGFFIGDLLLTHFPFPSSDAATLIYRRKGFFRTAAAAAATVQLAASRKQGKFIMKIELSYERAII